MRKIILLMAILTLSSTLLCGFDWGPSQASSFVQKWLNITDTLQVDGNAYLNGNIRIPNDTYIQGRDNADSSYLGMWKVNTSDEIQQKDI